MESAFHPAPLLKNAHLQTVLGTILSGPPLGAPVRTHHVGLPDGDRIVLHENVPEAWLPGSPLALLVHGLGGCHLSGYMQRVARMLLLRGWKVFRMDLRGTGSGLALARKPYHGGCSDDLRAAVDSVVADNSGSPLTVIGFSLGGNIALKMAGEAADRPLPALAAVAALSPPIDLERCAELIGLPRNRLYERYFLKGLMAAVRRRQQLFPEEKVIRFPRRLTMKIFDDLYTAPRVGFRDSTDYYRRAASMPWIPRIRVPAFLLTARDDPFIAVKPFEALTAPSHIKIRIVQRGGHLGFIGLSAGRLARWAEERIVEWVATQHQARSLAI
jgi:predicted alpha/beta-fold hydrolase